MKAFCQTTCFSLETSVYDHDDCCCYCCYYPEAGPAREVGHVPSDNVSSATTEALEDERVEAPRPGVGT